MKAEVSGSLCVTAVLTFLCVAASMTEGREVMPVTVYRGERQEFKGFGASVEEQWPYNPDWRDFSLLPVDIRDSLSRRIWGELDFKYMRIWSSPFDNQQRDNKEHYYARWYAPKYNLFIDHAKKYQPGLKVYHTPFTRKHLGERIGNVNTWAAHCAAQVYYLREYGVQIDYAGIANEPEVHDEINEETAPILVRQYRRELNRWGLNDIEVVGPDCAATDPKARGIFQSIVSNSDALDALHAFSAHSYNWSITDEAAAIVEPLIMGGEKEFWQTEAGAGPCRDESEENAELASDVVAKYLADMNHLCSVWFYYLGITGRRSGWEGWARAYQCFGWVMTAYRNEYDTFDDAVMVLLKYYYFKQLSRTFRPGAVFRKSTAHANRVSGKYWRREDTTMVFAYGEKAPFYCAAAVNSDGSWAIGMNNHTGFVADPYSTPRPRVDFEAHITVEELVGRGDIPFTVYRCNANKGNPADPYIHPEGTVMMRNGVIVFDSLGQFDLVTLRSPPGVEAVSIRSAGAGSRGFENRLTVESLPRNSGTRVRFALDPAQGVSQMQPVTLAVYNSKGVIVRRLHSGNLPSGRHEYCWDNRSDAGIRLSNGRYFVGLRGTSIEQTAPVLLLE